jgi:hypothetical protein
MNLDQIKTELGNYFRVNSKEVRAMVYQEPQLAKYTRPITKVKGKFPAIHSVTGHVVQGFAAVWAELGETKMRVNELVNYHMKVNFPIIPSEIEGSWLAELDQLNLKPEQRPISQYIMEQELKPRVLADIEDLSCNGVYDANQIGTYGYAMNGLKKILSDGVANATNSMYKVPLAAITPTNIVGEVEKFEDLIPVTVRSFITKIYMSTKNRDRYLKNYRDNFGRNVDFKKGDAVMTYTGEREIIGLNCLNGSDVIFATPDSNFLQLKDLVEAPTVTDIQVLDYKVKVFMEFWLGYGFWMNQLVICSVTAGSGSGLTTDNETYFSGSLN